MKKQLKGIALILFGMLLVIVISVVIDYINEYNIIWSVAGVVCGIAGLTMVFTKE